MQALILAISSGREPRTLVCTTRNPSIRFVRPPGVRHLVYQAPSLGLKCEGPPVARRGGPITSDARCSFLQRCRLTCEPDFENYIYLGFQHLKVLRLRNPLTNFPPKSPDPPAKPIDDISYKKEEIFIPHPEKRKIIYNMSSSKPTIIIVHGSWHSPEHFAPLESNLKSHGYKTQTVWLPTMHYKRYPSLTPAKITLNDDISAVRSAITSELSSNLETDVVVMAHSSGTVIASSVIEDLDKTSRAKAGHSNGITALLVISGILVSSGMTTFDWAGGQVPPTVSVSTIPDPKDKTKEIKVSNPIADPGPVAIFYGDLPDEEAKRWAALCTHQIWAVNTTIVPFAGYKLPTLDVFYLVCEQDVALPAEFQRVMIQNADRDREEATKGGSEEGKENGGNLLGQFQKDSLASIEAVKQASEKILGQGQDGGDSSRGGKESAGGGASKVQVTSIQSSHSPFLSRIEETAQWVRRSCGEIV